MKKLLVFLVSCTPATDPPWQLAHDRILAVRVEPPALLPGEIAGLEVLVAHRGGPTTVEVPSQLSAPGSPYFTAVHFNIDRWEVVGPDVTEPVALHLELRVPGPLYATKEMLLGATAANPPLPPVTVPPLTVGEHTLLIEADNVRWFTSCGELVAAEQPRATLILDEPCTGELVVVVREGIGVVWNVWPIR